MAMICVYDGRECDGCMECYDDEDYYDCRHELNEEEFD